MSSAERIRAELITAAQELGADASVDPVIERPRDPSHGDLSTNLAMQLARRERSNPRAMADRVIAALLLPDGMVSATEVAGPGFINFRLAADTLAADCARILDQGADYGRQVAVAPRRINVEFVSANPTGPLHVGHGRGAALGDAIATLLEWAGHDVTREFYVNDAGVQVDNVVASLWARVMQRHGHDVPLPEKGYHGEYLRETASGKAVSFLSSSRSMSPSAPSSIGPVAASGVMPALRKMPLIRACAICT